MRWAQRFVKRNGFSLRSPNQLGPRSLTITDLVITDYFSVLTDYLSSIDFVSHPELILNMNETGWSKGQQFKRKIVTEKGKRPNVPKSITIDHITSTHTISGNGDILTPFIVFKGSIPLAIQNEQPNEWHYQRSESGFMNSALFLLWLQIVILPYVKKMKKKVLLILDNASCHLSVEGLTFARNNDIEILSLPPNTTNFLQPLDQLFFVLKNSFYNIASRLQLIRPGNTIRPCNFPHVLKQAMSESWGCNIVRSSFRKTGIIPINPNAIDFTPTQSPPPPELETADAPPSPCTECGRIEPCQRCWVSSNPLVKTGLISNEVVAKVLFPSPIEGPKKQKTTNGNARRLTQDLPQTNQTNPTNDTDSINTTNNKSKKGKKGSQRHL